MSGCGCVLYTKERRGRSRVSRVKVLFLSSNCYIVVIRKGIPCLFFFFFNDSKCYFTLGEQISAYLHRIIF